MKRYFLFLLILLVYRPESDAQIKVNPRLDHTTVYVKDLPRSRAFYHTIMELDTLSEPFHDGKHCWFKVGSGIQLHVIQGAKEKIKHDINIHLAFTVVSLDDFIAHLKKEHVVFGDWAGDYGKTIRRPDGVDQLYLQDPDGYWIEVNNDRG